MGKYVAGFTVSLGASPLLLGAEALDHMVLHKLEVWGVVVEANDSVKMTRGGEAATSQKGLPPAEY
jgi:hypothetical protein